MPIMQKGRLCGHSPEKRR